MGAIQESNAIFLTITNGKICRKVMKPTDKSVERVNKNGITVNEEYYKGWKGRITDIQVREHKEFGKFWNVTLSDEDGDAILQMNYSSGYSAAFLKTLPNIDLTSDVIITPNLRMEGDKKKTALFITQHGTALKHYYTKDNPNGIPQLRKIKVKGKDTWDDTEIMEYLENMVATEIRPKLTKVGSSSSAPVVAGDDDVNADDLPF